MATYPLVPHRVLAVVPEFKTTVVKFENTTNEQRTTNQAGTKRRFQLLHEALKVATDFTTLFDFYVARKGAWGSFTFVHPHTSENITARFATDTLSFEYINNRWVKVTVEIVEC